MYRKKVILSISPTISIRSNKPPPQISSHTNKFTNSPASFPVGERDAVA